ncbi:unnamed protein product [Bursaphelenchus okinawaensis]|uniref:Uncharacterized protein n=1 Tax=Bursaphelenchus okinawaensis TaxID=465554 RepID=A0A811L2V6_9BILA|nr:unnamed protein product [Bursaphelenchus okinawaensis]CAG9115609.1 unnamed protein product [Bursaphelenchus okinawaensis]
MNFLFVILVAITFILSQGAQTNDRVRRQWGYPPPYYGPPPPYGGPYGGGGRFRPYGERVTITKTITKTFP